LTFGGHGITRGATFAARSAPPDIATPTSGKLRTRGTGVFPGGSGGR